MPPPRPGMKRMRKLAMRSDAARATGHARAGRRAAKKAMSSGCAPRPGSIRPPIERKPCGGCARCAPPLPRCYGGAHSGRGRRSRSRPRLLLERDFPSKFRCHSRLRGQASSGYAAGALGDLPSYFNHFQATSPCVVGLVHVSSSPAVNEVIVRFCSVPSRFG